MTLKHFPDKYNQTKTLFAEMEGSLKTPLMLFRKAPKGIP
jgi:hypothetical protein